MSGVRLPTDLSGSTFGRLTVVAVIRYEVRGRKGGYLYTCVCTCGRQLQEHQHRLLSGRADACETCRLEKPCVVCGVSFVSRTTRVTCSDVCAEINRRDRWLGYYYRRVAENPDANAQRAMAVKEKLAKSPAAAALEKERQHARSVRRYAAKTPEQRAAEREKARQRYSERRPEIMAERRRKREELSAEKIAARREKSRAYWLRIRDRVLANRAARRDADKTRAAARVLRIERERVRAATAVRRLADDLMNKTEKPQ